MTDIYQQKFPTKELSEKFKRAIAISQTAYRRLPRQVDKLEVEISALPTLGRYTSGGRLPRDS